MSPENTNLKYIGSPYTSPAQIEKDERADRAAAFAAHCSLQGHVVYSPIAAWHHTALEYALPDDFTFWRKHNFQMLRFASELWVLRLDGWEESAGLEAEMKLAKVLYLPIRYFNGDNFQEEI